jgi:ATP-binding cassette subfamily B protein/subfamily B ATP-binding cassette protein MsbA
MQQPASSKLRYRRWRADPTVDRSVEPSGDASANGKHGPNNDGTDGAKKASPERKRYLREYVRWLWPHRWTLAFLLLLAVVATALDMLWPLAIKRVIDQVLTGDGDPAVRLKQLNGLGLGIIAVVAVKQLIDSYRSYRTAALNAKVIFRLRGRLFDKTMRLSLSELHRMKSGGIVSRLSGDVDSVSGLVQMAIISPGVAAIRVILTLAILVTLSWQLAIAALIALPPLGFTSWIWMKRVRPLYRSMRNDRGTIDAQVTEVFGGIRVVRAFRREKREEKGYALGHHTVIRKSLAAEWLEILLGSIWGLLIPLTTLLVVWFGGWLVLQGRATAGDIFIFQIYAVMLLQPMWQIINSISQTQRSLAAMERVFEVLNLPADKPDVPGAREASTRVESLRFENVDFAYRAGIPVLSDISLDVPGGATVALVGPSGAGKTTLTDLVARFHDPTSGRVLLNGVDLKQLQLASYRRLLAVVQQDTFLFDGSVRDNIAYGRRDASDEAVAEAARRANAHDFIAALPEGYDTQIGERGVKLSGGQRQRISIARALLADPQILILDEATSNLDTESEQLIQRSLAELLKGRTTFVIAHRLSTVTHADLIVVLDRGRVVESGRHDELLAKDGMYAEMVRRQQRGLTHDGELEAAGDPMLA